MTLNIEPNISRPGFGKNQSNTESSDAPKKESKSSSAPYWIGAGAVAASVIAGIIIHKQLKVKPPKTDCPSHKTLTQIINNIKGTFNIEPLDTKLKDLERIKNKQEKAARLSNFLSDLDLGQSYFIFKSGKLPRGMKELPKSVQDAIENRDFETAITEFKKAVNELPPTYKSFDAGKTIEESVKNVLGENSGIISHNYDITKENPRIHVYRSNGGYKDGVVNSKNEIYYNYLSPKEVIDEAPAVSQRPFRDKNCNTQTEFLNYGYMYKSDRRLVRLSFSDGDVKNPKGVEVSLLSPNSEYTPAQKDLIKLIDQGLTKEQIETFRKLTNGIDNGYRDGKLDPSIERQFTALNYDAILSAIQTFANQI